MNNGRIPNDIMYGVLATGHRLADDRTLRFKKHIFKRYRKRAGIDSRNS